MLLGQRVRGPTFEQVLVHPMQHQVGHRSPSPRLPHEADPPVWMLDLSWEVAMGLAEMVDALDLRKVVWV